MLEEIGRLDLQLDEMPHRLQGVAKEKPRPLQRAEEVADHRETPPLDARVQDRRSLGLVHAALNFRRFKIGVDFLVDADQLASPLEILHALPQTAITHRSPQ